MKIAVHIALCGIISIFSGRMVLSEKTIINQQGSTVESRFPVPDDYIRVSVKDKSFASYLRRLPLKPVGSMVKYFDGSDKTKKDVYLSVIDFDIDPVNLQQCADAIIRLRSEYLYAHQRYDEIRFSFSNGSVASYTEWMKGKRISVNGRNVKWIQKAPPSNSSADLRKYLLTVYTYAGTLSLSRDCVKINKIESMQIGDLLIQGGSPGHAVIIVDMAVNKSNGKKIFMLAQSYMPAQDIQILVNPSDPAGGPWYSIPSADELITPEWVFAKKDLRRFRGE